MTRSNLLAVLVALTIVGGLVGGGWYWYSQALEPQLANVRVAIGQNDIEAATEQIDRILLSHPDSLVARELAIDVARRSDDSELLVKHLEWMVEHDADVSVHARALGDVCLAAAQFDRAEQWFVRALEEDPTSHAVISRLTRILSDQGRRWEAHRLYMQLIRSGQFEINDLVLAGQTENMVTLQKEYIAQRYADRSQIGPLLGIARFGMATGDADVAEELLREVIAKRPELIEAKIRLCELMREKRPQEFVKLIESLPDEAETHPAFWVELGKWYRTNQEPRYAIACFAQALRLDPNRQFASFALGQLLAQQGHGEIAAEFRERAEKLDTVTAKLSGFFTGEATMDDARVLSDLMQTLGRYWESAAWAQYALSIQHYDWCTARLRRLQPILKESLPNVRGDFNPVLRLKVEDWPLPTEEEFQVVVRRVRAGSAGTDGLSPIAFRNVAGDLGMDFRYFNGAVVDSQEHRMYEFTGGGVGVIDYDLDGWPDTFFPNGTRWPAGSAKEFSDALFHNQGDRFVNSTTAARISEAGFGQGVAIGDFDADGFPDVYVANIGQNQLWRNNGDGTFSDVTEAVGISTSVWTSSALIADLNGDGLADIYDVNFLGGDDVFTRVCEVDGKPRSCQPDAFPGEQDRVLLNRGDGTFADVTESAGVVRPRGNGLGIIAADFDGSRRLNLFIANDSVPNFYYLNESAADAIALSESAVLSGVDVDYQGEPQACMGVGVSDVDGNGLPDLFITNFHDESNSLYLQQAANVFSDECRPSGIRDISRKLLGFGTQFLDVDLNGHPDLAVTNGHVDDFTHEGIPYQMRPQILRHSGGSSVSFVEQQPTPVDEYFSGTYLGRGLARLDFNRDGLDDFAVSHLDAPAALVRNDTAKHGAFLSIRLIATQSERTAIGAVVHVRCGGKTQAVQLTAGDGYMASNERRLNIGLGDAAGDCSVEVRWMSGATESMGSVGADTHVIAIEGSGELLREPR